MASFPWFALVLIAGTIAAQRGQSQEAAAAKPHLPDVSSRKGFGTHFQLSERCVACHNGLTTPEGEDISIGTDWQASMMGNAGRDPYWLAGVRRELIDHPVAADAIQDECTICHMPMMRYESKLAGGRGEVFAHFPPNPQKLSDRLAADGVSCTVCHQITAENLGKTESFVGGFKIDEKTPPGQRRIFGPYAIDPGHVTIMRSSSMFQPTEGKEVIQSSELCATCHTLITQALDAEGRKIGELPEQVPYQEWLHSSYRDGVSCQSCHMPVVPLDVPITGTFGEPRAGFSRHVFVGGNFFMQRMLNRYRDDLGVTATLKALDAAATRTVMNLQSNAARVAIDRLEESTGRLLVEVSVRNLTGHKLPTAYPSRRVWLHLMVRDGNHRVVFESGALEPDGRIQGNDNDADPTRFEPHYTEITSSDQVQIYESIMVGPSNVVTTGLLTAVRFVKDNRLLPNGFDKATATGNIAVRGSALDDPDFLGGGDRIRYTVTLGDAEGPFTVDAELWYQPISYRWASNLRPYDAGEPRRFVRYYDSLASSSAVMLARASVVK